MTFTADQPIISWTDITPQQIDGWIALRGQALAAQYAPDGVYRPAPAGLGELALQAARYYPEAPVNPYLLTSQVDVESAAWQSALAREKNNPTGYGAEDDDPWRKATTFASPWEALFNTANHLRVYALGDGPWFAGDLRATKIPVGNRGRITTVRQLSGTYASDTTYHNKIVTRMNLLLAFEGGTPIVAGPIPKPPMRIDVRAVNYGHNYLANGGRVVEAIVNHIGEGTSRSNLSYLSTGPVSCNYFIHEDGTIYELVPPQFSAWTNGDMKNPDRSNPLIEKWSRMGWNPNVRTLTIEHGGYSRRGAGGMLTPAQWTSSIWLQAWLCQEYRLSVDRTHILGHYQINSVDKQHCPGFSTAEWDKLLAGIRSYGAPVVSADPTNPWFLNLGDRPAEFAFRSGFRGVVEGLAQSRYPADPNSAALALVGEPLEDEWEGTDGHAYQRCKRVILHYIPGQLQPWDVIFEDVNYPLPERKVGS